MTAPPRRAWIATVRLSGASAALLRVVQSLTGSVDGASTLDYLGDPSVQVSTSGASVVRRACRSHSAVSADARHEAVDPCPRAGRQCRLDAFVRGGPLVSIRQGQ